MEAYRKMKGRQRNPRNLHARMNTFFRCNPGMKRTNNEDSTLVVQYVGSGGNHRSGGWLLALADGMGGHERGEVASSLALKTLASHVLSNSLPLSSNDHKNPLTILEGAFAKANDAVFNKGSGSSPKMGTTLVVAYVVGVELYLCSVGDSRCYTLSDNEILQATRDDSVVQELVDAGKITKEQAMSHPRRNEITNAIGIYGTDEFEVSAFRAGSIKDIDYILLSSDGLHGILTDSEIAETIYSKEQSIRSASGELVNLANEKGGPDNISLILGLFKNEKGAH